MLLLQHANAFWGEARAASTHQAALDSWFELADHLPSFQLGPVDALEEWMTLHRISTTRATAQTLSRITGQQTFQKVQSIAGPAGKQMGWDC